MNDLYEKNVFKHVLKHVAYCRHLAITFPVYAEKRDFFLSNFDLNNSRKIFGRSTDEGISTTKQIETIWINAHVSYSLCVLSECFSKIRKYIRRNMCICTFINQIQTVQWIGFWLKHVLKTEENKRNVLFTKRKNAFLNQICMVVCIPLEHRASHHHQKAIIGDQARPQVYDIFDRNHVNGLI